MLSPHGNVLIYIDPQKGHLRDNVFKLHFERVFFFVLKDFDQSYIVRVANNSQEKFTILHVPHVGFLCYSE